MIRCLLSCGARPYYNLNVVGLLVETLYYVSVAGNNEHRSKVG